MPKKKPREFSQEFREKALARMEAGENVTALAKELGVLRKSLYAWKDTFAKKGKAGLAQQRGRPAPKPKPAEPPATSTGSLSRAERLQFQARIAELERKVGKQELLIDFFAGALQRIEAVEAKSKPKSSSPTSVTDPSKGSSR